MKNLDLNIYDVQEIGIKEQGKINGGSIFYWFGYVMGILAAENVKLSAENPIAAANMRIHR